MIEEISGAGGGKGGGGEARTPVEAPNTLRSAATARILDLLGEGPIVGLVDGMKSVFLDDTPLQNADGSYNFQGVTIHTRTGEAAQSRIPGFAAIESEVNVSAQVKTTQPIVRAISNPEIDAVRIKIRVPTLSKTNVSTGDVKGTSVTLAVDVMPSGGEWQELKTIVITGKTTSAYERQTRVDLVGQGPWNVRVRRITADSIKSNLQNETYWSTYTEITDAKLTYPDSALVGIQIDARQFGNSVPGRSYDVKGRIIKVPSNYDPDTRAYTGIWNGTFKLAWTDNPAWVFYDMASHSRYGANQANVDKWALYQIGQYCDELVPNGYGGMEPRFAVNTVLAAQTDAIAALGQMASAFRGMTYWGTNTAVAVADMPADPVKLVTPSNVIGGDFEYSGTSLRDRHSAVAVTWNDPEDDYRQQVEIVEDPDAVRQFGWRQTDVTAFGCTSRGQAHRFGKWILYSERSETETVTYSAGTDHLDARPGDVVAVSDPATAGARMGGRLQASGLTTLTLDAAPDNTAGSTWFLDVVLPTGVIERRQVLSFSGNYVTLAEPLSAEPITGAMWVLSSMSLQPRLFRIVSVTEADGPRYQVTAAEYNPHKYDQVELGMPAFEPTISLPASPPGPVAGLAATDITYRSGSGIATKLVVSWDRSDDAAVTWQVKIRDAEDGNWDTLERVPNPYIEIPNVTDDATYVVECYGVNSTGTLSTEAAVVTHTVIGKVRPPADVTGFVSVPSGSALKILWDNVPDVDLKEYEVRYDDIGWGDGNAAAIAYKGPSTSFTAEAGSLAAVDTTLFIKAVDTSGNYSEQAALLNVVYVKPATPAVSVTYYDTSSVDAKALLKWAPSTSDFPIYQYEITTVRPGGATTTVTQASTTFDLPLDFLGTASISVVAVDTYGKRSNSGLVMVDSLIPVSPTTFSFTSIGIGLLQLSWGLGGRTTLPIAGYEVRTSNAGWGQAGAVYRGSALMCQINQISIGANLLYIKAFDTEGRYSATPLTATYNYAGPAITGGITADFNTVTANNDALMVYWPELVSPFGVEKYVATLVRPDRVEPTVHTTRSNEWAISLGWVGTAELSVVGYDNAGNATTTLTKSLVRTAPGSVLSTSLKLISYSTKKMTVAVEWPTTGVMGTLPIAGYEIRLSDAGWGTPGAIYRGEMNQATLVDLSTSEDLVYYLKAYDLNGAYSTLPLSVNILKNVGPEPVTELQVKPNGQYLRMKWKASLSTKGEVFYEVRKLDEGWGTAEGRLYYGTALNCDLTLETLGDHVFYIRALDKFWEYSLTSMIEYTYEVSPVAALAYNFGASAEPTVTLTWEHAKPSFGLADYAVFDGTSTIYLNANSLTLPAKWTGNRTFTVTTRDSNLNLSAAVSVVVPVTAPPVTTVTPSFTLGAKANGFATITLDWADSVPASLPIAGYEIRAADSGWGTGGAVYSGPSSKASISGVSMDTTTLWYLRAVDTAGNYSATSLLITHNGTQAPAAVTGLTYVEQGSGIKVLWGRSPEADVVEYEIRTSNSGWGSSGFVYRGAEPEYLVAKPPAGGATYYVKARDAYKQWSPVASVVFTYPMPGAVQQLTYTAVTSAGTVTVDWPDTNPPLLLKHYKVVYDAGSSTKTVTSKGSSVSLSGKWSGDETVSVTVVDTHGVESAPASIVVGLNPPGQVPAPVAEVTSFRAGKQTIKLDWADAVPGDFTIAGYEIRSVDSGWGTSGHLYKGATSQASLSNVSTTATSTWFIKAYDARKNYSALATRLDYVTELPNEVTSVKGKRVRATLELDAVTADKPADFLCVEYRIGKVTAGATQGDDAAGPQEGVIASMLEPVWNDPDVLSVSGTETSNKVVFDLNSFGKPLFSQTGITYRVEARIKDKAGNFSPNSAELTIKVKTLS